MEGGVGDAGGDAAGAVFGGAFWSVAGALISRGFLAGGFAGVRVVPGQEGFGALGMIQSTAGMLGVLAGLGLGITATKYVSELRRLDPLRARQSAPPGWESHGTIVE